VGIEPTPIDKFVANTRFDGYSADPAHADNFVPVPQVGGFDYSMVSAELAAVSGMLALPIRLVNGRQRGGGGYGICHMLYKHDNGIANNGYWSVQDFVDEVAQRFDSVYQGEFGRWLLVYHGGRNPSLRRLLVLELRKGEQPCYSIVSGWFVSARREINGTLVAEKIERDGVPVWERRAPRS